MKDLNPQELRERLIEIGYTDTPITDKAVEHLLALRGESADMLQEWYNTGRVKSFAPIEGIDKRFLKDGLKMKEPAIIMAYGMLLENPRYIAMLFKKKAAELGYRE